MIIIMIKNKTETLKQNNKLDVRKSSNIGKSECFSTFSLVIILKLCVGHFEEKTLTIELLFMLSFHIGLFVFILNSIFHLISENNMVAMLNAFFDRINTDVRGQIVRWNIFILFLVCPNKHILENDIWEEIPLGTQKCLKDNYFNLTLLLNYLLAALSEKRTFGHVCLAKIQITLRIRAVWSESWLGAFWIANHYENTPIQMYRKFHLQKLKIFK